MSIIISSATCTRRVMRKISFSHLLDNWRQDIRKTNFFVRLKNGSQKNLIPARVGK